MKANRSLREFKEDKTAIARVMGGMVALLIGIIIGILVFYNINENLDLDTVNNANAGWGTSWDSVNTTASTVWTLAPIVAIVSIAGVILAVVMDFGRGGGGV